MADDNSNNNGAGGRRRSMASEALNSIFGRSSSTTGTTGPSNGSQPVSNTPRPPRRMSITTLGLNTGTSPIQTSYFRRGSESTGESAIEDDDETTPYAQSVPTTPFTRRMSIGAGAMLGSRGGTSPGATPGEGLNVYDQFRTRAQSSVMARPSLGGGGIGVGGGGSPNATAKPMTISNDGKGFHERARSISDMPEPPKVIPAPEQKPKREYVKPDQLGERMLRGEFLMD